MPDRNAELKARLMAEAEAAIVQMLAEAMPPGQESLADIERSARTAGQRIEQAIAVGLAGAGAGALPAWPDCPSCGRRMKNKGRRRRRVVTESGEIEVTRSYYYCPTCRRGLFPPG
jgi:hypothetical protein